MIYSEEVSKEFSSKVMNKRFAAERLKYETVECVDHCIPVSQSALKDVPSSDMLEVADASVRDTSSTGDNSPSCTPATSSSSSVDAGSHCSYMHYASDTKTF